MNAFVDRPEDLTARWLTEALQSAGHDLRPAGATYEPVGTGQMGRTVRLHLTYEGCKGPSTLIAKMAGEDEATRALVAPGYAAEVGFYTELAPSLRVRTPSAWYGAISADHTQFTLLLDDLAPAMPGQQAAGCSVKQAGAALDNLIGLHAPRWGDPTLEAMEFLMRPDPEMAAMMRQVMTSAADEFVERYRDELGAEHAQTLRDAAVVIEKWQLARISPFSVLHGDYRLDNLLFHPVTAAASVVDWQTAAIGPPLRDVAYFLGTCLESADRRAHEESLVRRYHEALLGAGVAGYGADACWTDYRLGQLQGPMITVIGCIYASAERTPRSDAMFVAMARRSSTAIRDLGSLELV